MDYFKPLYKSHKRQQLSEINAFDPRKDGLTFGKYIFTKKDNIITCDQIKGLQIIPNFLNIQDQKQIVYESLVTFLEPAEHKTNLDAHHELQRPIKLFSNKRLKIRGEPLIRDKIRWVTLGGQYNWTLKVYPSFEIGSEGCPEFPNSRVKSAAEKFNCTPQAAIVNYYAEGDILSPHQDVAELVKRDLVSFSLGCACVFYLARERFDDEPLPVILRSGDALVMGNDARFAFHGVGKVFKDTSPPELLDSLNEEGFPEWISGHRINVNIRQMV